MSQSRRGPRDIKKETSLNLRLISEFLNYIFYITTTLLIISTILFIFVNMDEAAKIATGLCIIFNGISSIGSFFGSRYLRKKDKEISD